MWAEARAGDDRRKQAPTIEQLREKRRRFERRSGRDRRVDSIREELRDERSIVVDPERKNPTDPDHS